jgi:hypothetical protein
MDIYRQLEAREARRIKSENRYHARIAAREEAAEKMIGELGSGKCYVWPVGGKYREGSRLELVQFLIRNRYA